MPFSVQTLDFLTENKLHDSKDWFHEHREQYDEYVIRPMTELLEKLAPEVISIDPQIVCAPKTGRGFSRIYRDTRFSKDKSTFRDNMWIVFMRDRRENRERPAFVFEFSPRGFDCGCGFWCAERETLDRIHDRILNRPDMFEPANAVLSEGFSIFSESRKRPKYREVSPEQSMWLEKKNLYIAKSSRDYDLLLSDKLAGALIEDYKKLAPVYELLMVN